MSVEGLYGLSCICLWKKENDVDAQKKRGELAEVPEAAGKVALKRALKRRWLTIKIKKRRMFEKGGFLNVV